MKTEFSDQNLQFVCQGCSCQTLEVVYESVTYSSISNIDCDSEYCDCSEERTEIEDTLRFQCKSCGQPIKNGDGTDCTSIQEVVASIKSFNDAMGDSATLSA